MSELADALIASGWLASKDDSAGLLDALPVGTDVLPLLVTAARTMDTLARPKTNKAKMGKSAHPPLAQVLTWAMQCGAKLTVGWRGSEDHPLERWLGSRLMWWPRGIPGGRKVAWVSSRLGRAIDERPDWFSVLRSATAKLDPARDVLLTASNTTVDRFLERAAILFDLRRLRVHLDEHRTLVDWLTRLRRQIRRSYLVGSGVSGAVGSPTSQVMASSEVFLSPIQTNPERQRGRTLQDTLNQERHGAPALGGVSGYSDEQDAAFAALPLSDRVLIAVADQVFALQVRPKGNLHQLLRARLSDSAWPTASVWLALGDALVPNEVASELQSLGAVGWWLFAEHVSHMLESQQRMSMLEMCPTITELPWPDGDYFVHWTRRRDGPWPEQTETDFLDDLLLSRDSISHSAFAALSRIVRQRRMIASSAGIRGGSAVVSFSAKPLHELTQQRTFRAHRGRWDCEAYGLCVRREWLQARGARPVIYGDDELWSSLPESEQALFQLKTTRPRRGEKSIDWSQETEWRVPQDVDFSEADRADVALFVPSEAEARQLAVISPWPVLVLTPRSARVS